MNIRPRILVGLLIVSVAAPGASAQEPAAAEAAFREGRALMKDGRYREARDKLALSHRLDPAIGTLTNLGICHEKLGKLATGWAQLNEAADLAARAGQSDRAKKIRAYARALEPRLPRLLIRIAGVRPPGLVVTRDGAEITMILGTAVPVDPGTFVVEASAAGRARWRRTIEIVEGEAVNVEIDLAPVDSRRTRRRIALWLGVGGAAVAVAGLGFGWRAHALYDDSRAHCDADNLCDDRGLTLIDRSFTSANVSNVLLGAGAAAMFGAGVLWYLSREDSERQMRLVPEAGPDRIALAITGRF